jgi:hypothetical protein
MLDQQRRRNFNCNLSHPEDFEETACGMAEQPQSSFGIDGF